MKYTNPTGDHITVPGILREPVPPGATVEIPDAYCRRRPGQVEGKWKPPVITQLAPQLVPAEDRKLEPAQVPGPRAIPTAKDLEAQGMSPGVAEVEARRIAAKAAPKPKPEG